MGWMLCAVVVRSAVLESAPSLVDQSQYHSHYRQLQVCSRQMAVGVKDERQSGLVESSHIQASVASQQASLKTNRADAAQEPWNLER